MTAKKDNVADTRPSAGWKECPHCSKWVKGTRTSECPNCGKPIPSKEAKGKGKAKSKTTCDLSLAIQTLDRVKTFIGKHGGDQKANALLDDLQTLIDDCGSLDDVKEAIATLSKWEKSK